ncbi:uncharacterized protein aftphb [Pholidichthys leucotaenia]
MEPNLIPFHPSSPPQLDDDDDDGDGGMASEEDEFGSFSVGVPCSPLSFSDATEPPPSFVHPSPVVKPATHQPSCTSVHLAEQSQPTSTVTPGQDCDTESSLHLTNGFTEGDYGALTVTACSPLEETGFADFTVFSEQTANPWCCGFSPISGAEQWGGAVGEQICDSGQKVIMKSGLGVHCAHKVKGEVYTEIEHCEKRDAALVQPSQGHHQPQEAAEGQNLTGAEEAQGEPGASPREMRGFNSLQPSDDEETEDVFKTCSMHEPASEDLASFSDDLSFEGASADLEQYVSSLASISQGDLTDWDPTDEEDKDLEYQGPTSAKPSHSEVDPYNRRPTQETSATSSQSQCGINLEQKPADFTAGEQELHQTADRGVLILGNLPLSDSFADFCSAPTWEEDEERLWVEFKEQRGQGEGKSWMQFSKPGDAVEEEEEERTRRCGGTRKNSCQASATCRVQQLLRLSFPEVLVPAAEGDEELQGLSALLQTPNPTEQEEAMPELSSAHRTRREMMWPHQDVHNAFGLQFQWGGSHTNKTLLSVLGVDTRNIVFFGKKKQPMTVPAFASGLGMLEPTKDCAAAVNSPERTAVTAQTPPTSRDIPDPSVHTAQVELPSSQLDWSSRGLSSSQDGMSPHRAPHFWGRNVDGSALNLDYFGPEEEVSSSCRESPPPGVDFELYKLTVGQLETSTTSSHLEDTFNCLMSAAEKTSISARKPVAAEDLSAEAGRVIAGLPNLSFLQAKVLMFPSILPQSDTDLH